MRRVLALCGCAAVLLAACGGDDAARGTPLRGGRCAVRVRVPARPDRDPAAAPGDRAQRDRRSRRRWARTRRTTCTSRPTTPRCRSISRTRRARTRSIAPRSSWPRTRAGRSARASRRSSGRSTRSSTRWRRSTPGARAASIYAFSGPVEYFVRCEWEYDVSPTIPVACDQVQRSFEPLAAAADTGGTSQPAATTAPASSSGDSPGPRERPIARIRGGPRALPDALLLRLAQVAPGSTVGDDRRRYRARAPTGTSARSARRAAGLGREPRTRRTNVDVRSAIEEARGNDGPGDEKAARADPDRARPSPAPIRQWPARSARSASAAWPAPAGSPRAAGRR